MKRILWELLKVLVLVAAVYIRVFDPLDFHGTYTNNLANTLINFVIFVVGANLILQMIEYYFGRNKAAAANVKLGLRNIYYIFVALAMLMVGLSLIGIDYRTLFTSLSIVGAAIAIVTKDFIAEILSGIILSFSKRMLINDYVKIGDMKGKILDMGLHKITFLNDDDDIIFIPNTTVYNSEIINYTQSDQRRISIDFQMIIAHVDNFEKLEHELNTALNEFQPLIEPGTFVFKITHLTKDVVDLKLLFTSKSSEPDLIRDLRRRVTRKVLNYVKSKIPVAANNQIPVKPGPTERPSPISTLKRKDDI
ncbi:MAG TPA: mechanosensitive ion channel domain-containing protein [Saprospiraceae bacterium]|nr:mechanosensitive ion channel domain-containing protein [Saprospiraceae bacterium]